MQMKLPSNRSILKNLKGLEYLEYVLEYLVMWMETSNFVPGETSR